MTPEQAKALRAPFPAECIGKLPRVSCRACGNAPGRVCPEHRKARCEVCENNITSAHLHLDYVGHGDVTDRLLAVDPEWTWEPYALDADGLPKVTANGELWIRLTVAGVTRPGVGTAEGGNETAKQLISDAIRNASMRFGVALDLWIKGERETPKDDTPPPGAKTAGWSSAHEEHTAHATLAARIQTLDADTRKMCKDYTSEHGWPMPRPDFEQLAALVDDCLAEQGRPFEAEQTELVGS